MRKVILVVVMTAALGAALGAQAQPYPAKAIRVIAGFPPGSGADITARVIGAKLNDALGQQVIVDNRPGAGSNIAADLAAKSPPDGYTLFIGTVANTINAEIVKVLSLPDVRQQFANQGIETLGGTPEQFASYIRDEIAKWAKVIKLSGASAN